MRDITIVGKDKMIKINNPKIFYHGGINKNFSISDIDIYRPAEKQQNKNNSYVGFYMYDEDNYVGSINYAIQQNEIKDTSDKGVAKIVMNDNLQVYEVPPFSITRLTMEQLKELKKQGYDIVKGKMLNKYEYVLLNKAKIINLQYMNLEECLESLNKDQINQIKEEIYTQIKKR